jgi:hypothetical protein
MPAKQWTTALTILVLLLFHGESRSQEYILLGWNDLGMHCSNKDFSKVVVLPPYNNVSAQLVFRSPGQPPELVTSGYTVEYSIPGNTYSVGKTDFWTYAQQLFGLASPLPANIGLTGKGLTGVLESSGAMFSAHGIPITPFTDSDLVNEAPFQLVHLVAKRESDGSVLAETDAVIPVSNEVGCVQPGCHASETSILNSHEDVDGFNRSGPVLCASCHASNALGTAGTPEARSFSYRMHEKHTEVAGAANDIATCYKCHPGPKTQCLRDVMGKNPANPMVCQDCHGTMETVAQSISNGRRPWFDEPKCGTCHGAAFAEEPGKLFRQSTGHGGLACSACHGSPHAILPTVEPNDNLQNIRLQGYAGTLGKCSVCHATTPAGPGPHGLTDTTTVIAAAPDLTSPPDGAVGITIRPTLQWSAPAHAASYELQLAADPLFALLTMDDSTLGQPWYLASPLDSNRQYYWRVRALNQAGRSLWSATRSFTTTSGSVVAFSVNKFWNIVSLPMAVENAGVGSLFPSATTQAYSFSSSTGYEPTGILSPGPGYWLRFPSAGPMSITGTPLAQETVAIAPGWNLIGSVAESLSVQSIRTLPEGLLASSFFGYDGGYFITQAIAPGRGYWVTANGSGLLILSRAARAKAAPMPLAAAGVEHDMLRIRDALGREQTLYLSGGRPEAMAASWCAAPPAPPAGAFDVRFATDRYLEHYAGNREATFEVRVSGASDPVTLTWRLREGSPLRSIDAERGALALAGDGSLVLPPGVSALRFHAAGSSAVPADFALDQNYPNPFNPSTTIRYGLPFKSDVHLSVYNLSGERVAELVNGKQDAGFHEARWSTDLASGIYFTRLEAVSVDNPRASHLQTRKMLLLR